MAVHSFGSPSGCARNVELRSSGHHKPITEGRIKKKNAQLVLTSKKQRRLLYNEEGT